MTGNQIDKWADKAMFSSEAHNAAIGPLVTLLGASADPLGQIAACAKMYMGEVVRDLDDVTDEERRYYAAEMQKTKLKMPLEAVSLHFMFENVTRAFTHQLVRQRTAAYAQESMRFAVVEDMNEAVALPPSLAWANGPDTTGQEFATIGDALASLHSGVVPYSEEFDRLPKNVRSYLSWRHTVSVISQGYTYQVNTVGMPAEDARGLMPTNIITRVNYITNFRGLLDHAGNRLCTQAQFEWRLVFAQIAKALREYGSKVFYTSRSWVQQDGGGYWDYAKHSSRWQFDILADLLRPVCYQTGSCQFGAGFDRACSIRDRVDANAAINRSSTEWDQAIQITPDNGTTGPVWIGDIQPREWLMDPAAAR